MNGQYIYISIGPKKATGQSLVKYSFSGNEPTLLGITSK